MYEICRHIKSDGIRCGSPAVKERPFCYHHDTAKKLARRRRRASHDFTYVIPFVFPEDRAAIQHNQFLVMRALAEGQIDRPTALAYTAMIRSCRLNLGKTPLIEHGKEKPVQRVILTPDGDEIATPLQCLEKDEPEPTHGPECPCLACAEKYRNAPAEQHHHECRCGLCQPTTPPSEKNQENPDPNTAHTTHAPTTRTAQTLKPQLIREREIENDQNEEDTSIETYRAIIQKWHAQQSTATTAQSNTDVPSY